MLSYQFIFNQSLNNLKLKLQLIVFKVSFQKILTAQSEEYSYLQEVINLDQFLINVIINYPLNLIINQNQYSKQILPELITMQVTEEDFSNNLSKYQGTIEYLIFKVSIDEQILHSEKKDLELIQKDFRELFIEETSSISPIERIMKIFEDIAIDESIKNVTDEKFNQLELIKEKEKYEKCLQQLRIVEKNNSIEHFKQFINQIDKVVKVLNNSFNQNLQIQKKLILIVKQFNKTDRRINKNDLS
ncbi:unnamed protein product [Paramecium pentaurelia]|uniref:Uncharacterized protein n=1 Tax=Paramecium pentaurelia TaxID=43138 RepID=A0A8S1TNA9_9CILI|nr:unnamed protein product [Paramecium pentaurelia]